jgi:phosphoglycerate dehydrogenase-like enzyme
MRILISDPVEQTCADILGAQGFQVDLRPNLPADELRRIIDVYDALIIRSGTRVTAEIIAAAKRMKVIGRAGAGVDNVDVDAATRQGIVVMNTPGGNTIAATEHTLSLLLSLCRNVPQANESIKQGKWERSKYIGTELSEKTIGIIGLGKIDREVALRCQAFGSSTAPEEGLWMKEPPVNHQLVQHPRVIATPHLGASTEEAQEKVARQIALQVVDFLKERGVSGAVNAEALQTALKSEVKPYVLLAEKLGSLVAQVMNGQLKKVVVTCSGASLFPSVELLTAAVLKGIFTHVMSEPVNLVNALVIAEEVGLLVEQQKESERDSYTNLITLRYETNKEARRFSGTVFGNIHPRLVRIDDFLLFYSNIDRPGMLAGVGAILAAEEINIAGLSLGRDQPGRKALTVINVDSPIPPDVLRKLGEIDGVFEVRAVRL